MRLLIIFSLILIILITLTACGNNSASENMSHNDDNYVVDDDASSDDDAFSDDESGGDDSGDDDLSDNDMMDDDFSDDDSSDDDSSSDEITYGPGNAIIGSDIGNEGYLYTINEDNKSMIDYYYNNIYDNSKDPELYETSITVIPKSKSTLGFKKYYLGSVYCVRVAHDSGGHLYYTYAKPFYKKTKWDHDELHFVTNVSGQWVDQILANELIFDFLRIAIDGEDHVHICYNNADKNIIYATNASGTWIFENIADYGIQPSITIDQQGFVHIAFTVLGTFLFYSTNNSGVWTSELVQITPPPPSGLLSGLDFPMIVITSSNDPIICDLNEIFQQLPMESYPYYTYIYCSQKTNGSWVINEALADSVVKSWPSLSIDKQDKLHLVYQIWETQKLAYATNASGEFVIEYISSDYHKYDIISSTLDQNGKVHVAFEVYNSSFIGYSTNTSGVWVTTILGPE